MSYLNFRGFILEFERAGAVLCPPSNILIVDRVRGFYSEANLLKSRDHYSPQMGRRRARRWLRPVRAAAVPRDARQHEHRDGDERTSRRNKRKARLCV